MACDYFRELEVFRSSGEIVIATPESYADLFFGLRGGGGNIVKTPGPDFLETKKADQIAVLGQLPGATHGTLLSFLV